MKKVLTIAGSDPSGGAGIQADIKTITVHKCYAMSVITALTAQNTMGVSGIYDISPEFIKMQLDSVFSDIFPDSVKIGMVSSGETIFAIAEKLKSYGAENIVLDPVMVSTSGASLMSNEAKELLQSELIPLCSLVTPNIPEAEFLSGMKIADEADMIKSAERIACKTNIAVLIKGGHSVSDATDILFADGKISRFAAERIDNPNTHGTGCTLSSAIAAELASGCSVEESVMNAKKYLTGAIAAMLDLGKGAGPLDHMYKLGL